MSGLLVSRVLESALPPWLRPFATVLASFADDDGQKIFPSVKRVARMAGRSERQAARALRTLRAYGVIEPVGFAPRRSNARAVVQYRFHVGALPQLGDPDQLALFPQRVQARNGKQAKD